MYIFLRYCHVYFSDSVKPHFPVFLWEWNRPQPLLPKLYSFSRYISQTLSCVFIWFCKTIFPCFPLRLYLERPQPLQCFTDFVPFRFSKYKVNGEDGLRYCFQMRVWLRERVKPPELWCFNQIGDLDVLLDCWMFLPTIYLVTIKFYAQFFLMMHLNKDCNFPLKKYKMQLDLKWL